MMRNLQLSKRIFTCIAFLTILLGICTNGFAATKIWLPTNGGAWTTATNWSGNSVPVTNDDIVINTDQSANITAVPTLTIFNLSISGNCTLVGAGSNRTLTIGGNADVDFTISSGKTLTIGTNLNITLASDAAATIDGTLTVNTSRTFNTNGNTVVTTVNSTGSIINHGAVTCATATKLRFESGSTYEHALNGGAIPTATWDAASNCKITGLTGNDPSGDGQAFGNLIYDCSGMTGNRTMASSGLSIAGDFEVLNTGIYRLLMAQANLNVSGNCTISDGFLISSGNNARTLNVAGNFILNGGTFDLSSGSRVGTLNVEGDFTHTEGTITETGTGSGSIEFNGSDAQVIESTGQSNTIAFTVAPTVAGTVEVAAGKTFTISSGSTFGISNTSSATEYTVKGILDNSGTITTSGTMAVADGGTYEHARDGGTIPAATWDVNSICYITGATSTAPAGYNQTFGNFTWECDQTTYLALGTITNRATTSILGNLTVARTGNRITGQNNDFNIEGDITIGGNFIIANSGDNPAIYRLCYGENRSQTVNGNVIITGGELAMNTNTGGSFLGTLNVKGDFIHTEGIVSDDTGGGTGIIVFTGTSKQTYTSGGTLSGQVSFKVNSGAYLQMGTGEAPAIISNGSSGAFTVVSGGTLGVTSPDGITTSGTTGNIQLTGTRTYSAGGNYIYNGTLAQVTGNGLTQNTPANVTIDNSAGVSLSNDLTTTGVLTLSNGLLKLSTYNLTLNNAVSGNPFSTTKMIVADETGVVRKNYSGTGSYLFPIGSNSNTPGYTPVTLNITAGTFSGASVDVNLKDVVHPQHADDDNYIKRYWVITQSGITNPIYNAEFTYVDDDVVGVEANYFPVKFDALPWTYPVGSVTASSNLITMTGLSNFSAFSAAGKLKVTAGASPTTICAGSTVNLTATATGGNSPYTYIWTSSPAGFNSTAQNPTVSPMASTTYAVVVTDGKNKTATDNVSITVNPLPVITSQPSELTICEGSSGSFSMLTSASSPTYQWKFSTPSDPSTWQDVPNSAGIISGATTNNLQILSADVSWNKFNVKCVVTSGGCMTESNPVVFTVNPLPSVYTLSGSSICASAPNTGTISLSNSQTGVSYQLKDAANNNVQTAKTGTTGTALTWTGLSAGSGYYVLATGTSPTYCSSQTSVVNVVENPLSTDFNVNGGGTYCGNDVAIGLSGSQTGVNYQLYLNGTTSVETVAGTGSAISFTPQITLGTYTVKATGSGGCENSMSGSAVISADTEAPVARCKDISVNLDANGQATITPAMINNGSTDNCGIASMSVSPSVLSCINMSGVNNGDYIVSAQSEDGNTTVKVTLTNIKLKLSQQWVDSYNAYFSFDYSVEVTGSPVTSFYTRQVHFYPNSLDMTADLTGISGSTQTSVFGLPGTYSSDKPVEEITASIKLLIGFQTQSSQLNNTYKNLIKSGGQIVTLTVTDVSGNSSTCQSNVTIVDHSSPVLNGLSSKSQNLGCVTKPVSGGYIVSGLSLNDTDFSDNCTPDTNITKQYKIVNNGTTFVDFGDDADGDASGYAFPEGISTVTYRVIDLSGNTSSEQSFSVELWYQPGVKNIQMN